MYDHGREWPHLDKKGKERKKNEGEKERSPEACFSGNA